MQQAPPKQQEQHEQLGSITVPPGGLKTLHLGMYERTMNEPKFHFVSSRADQTSLPHTSRELNAMVSTN